MTVSQPGWGPARARRACWMTTCLIAAQVMVVLITAGTILALRSQAIQAAEDTLTRRVAMMALAEERGLFAVKQQQDAVVASLRELGIATPDRFRALFADQASVAKLAGQAQALPQIAGIDVLDADGALVASIGAAPEVKDLPAALEPFHILPADEDLDLSSSLPSDRSDEQGYRLSQRVRGADGQMLGVISTRIGKAPFRDFCHDALSGLTAAFGIARLDGTPLVHCSTERLSLDANTALPTGVTYAGTPGFEAARAVVGVPVLALQRGITTGKQTQIAFYRLHGLPVVVSTALGLDATLRVWRENSLELVGAGVAMEALLIWAQLLLRRQRQMDDQVLRMQAQIIATDRGKLEAARELSAIADAMPGAVLRVRRDAQKGWVVVFITSSVRTLVGYTAEEVMERGGLCGFLDTDSKVLTHQALEDAWQNGVSSVEVTFRAKDGRDLLLLAHIQFDGASAEGEDVILVWTDITQERAMMAQLAHTAKMATLGELSTGMAHELNQPLATISLAAENALYALENKAERRVRDKLELIHGLAIRTSGILDHMKVFGRTGHGPCEPVRLQSVVESAEVLLTGKLAAAEVRIVHDLDPGLGRVLAKEVPLEQVLLNLVANSCDAYCSTGADVPAAQRVVEISARRVGGDVEIKVADHAGGVPAAVLPRLFEPFFTTKPVGKGTGVGLSICYGIITDMGGSIHAENAGDGMVFTIRLSAANADVGAST